MKVIVSGVNVEIAVRNAADKITELNRIFSDLFHKNEIVQEVIVDGQLLHEDYNTYILQHISEIEQLELRTIPCEQLIVEMTDELCSYLPRLLGGLDRISEPLYGEPSQDDWERFGQLMEGINWVYQAVETVKSLWERTTEHSSQVTNGFVLYLTKIADQLKDIEQAFDTKDYVQIADVIKYELRDIHERLINTLMPQVES